MKNLSLMKKSNLILYVFSIIFILPFFQPQYFNSNKITLVIYSFTFFRYVSYLFMIYSFYVLLKNKKITSTFIYLCLFLLIYLFSTFFNSTHLLIKCFVNCLNIIALFINLSYLFEKNKYVVTNALSFLFGSLVFINFLTIIFFPSGMYLDLSSGYYENWFLGYDNLHILYIFPCIFFNILNFKINRKKSLPLLFILVSIVSVVIRWSATSLVALLFLIIYFIDPLKKFVLRNYKKILIFVLILNFLIVIFRVQNIFEYIIVDLLNKSLTFTGRTYIWDNVISFIKEKPFLGYGFELSSFRYLKTSYFRAFHAHNEILEIIYKTGFIGFFVFVILNCNYLNKISKISDDSIKIIFILFTISYYFLAVTEFYSIINYIYLFAIVNVFVERRLSYD